uniref:Putative JmJC domain protein n=1 Tax=Drosophila-associated filamentous virus TaxID=2743186 RepID=A0A6M9TZZ8_9VIRU|nr:putative JmJC domain protein [Drosophila-associated filamentous virus]
MEFWPFLAQRSKEKKSSGTFSNIGMCMCASKYSIDDIIAYFINNLKNCIEFNTTDCNALILENVILGEKHYKIITKTLEHIVKILKKNNSVFHNIKYDIVEQKSIITKLLQQVKQSRLFNEYNDEEFSSPLQNQSIDNDYDGDINSESLNLINEILLKSILKLNESMMQKMKMRNCDEFDKISKLLLEDVGPLNTFWLSAKNLQKSHDNYNIRTSKLNGIYNKCFNIIVGSNDCNVLNDVDFANVDKNYGILQNLKNVEQKCGDGNVPSATFSIGLPKKMTALQTNQNYYAYINLHLGGAPRLWLIIHKTSMPELKILLRQRILQSALVDSAIKTCTNPLYHWKNIVVSTEWLIDNNIKYDIFAQYPGSVVFIREGAYFQTIDMGFNICEYISYAGQMDSCFENFKESCLCPNADKILINENRPAFRLTNSKILLKCQLCSGVNNKLFNANELKQHIINEHSTKSRYNCTKCNNFSTFNMTVLKAHLHTEHNRYFCYVCRTEVVYFTKHCKIKHKITISKASLMHKLFDPVYEHVFKNNCLTSLNDVQKIGKFFRV